MKVQVRAPIRSGDIPARGVIELYVNLQGAGEVALDITKLGEGNHRPDPQYRPGGGSRSLSQSARGARGIMDTLAREVEQATSWLLAAREGLTKPPTPGDK